MSINESEERMLFRDYKQQWSLWSLAEHCNEKLNMLLLLIATPQKEASGWQGNHMMQYMIIIYERHDFIRHNYAKVAILRSE